MSKSLNQSTLLSSEFVLHPVSKALGLRCGWEEFMGKPEKPGLRLATTGKWLSSPSLGHRMKPKGLDAMWFAQRGRGRLGWERQRLSQLGYKGCKRYTRSACDHHNFLHSSNESVFLPVRMLPEVALLIAFKPFSFAFTTWLPVWHKRPSFWPLSAFGVPSPLS